ncbi:Rab3 GTPase-activating protein catalytic subunit [Parelaphostrongylus tenuis]|uniref:Rab3 GTPase-activating protein catalytic subunit n=1 Tax=Parelaphostrongylus tenuis TaxID=148309 RepID=A0AAD5MD66_PARTN|nr:Rab3 GTPase-activating protein catalytic subunit [Parelaphostrongylus tenuis]
MEKEGVEEIFEIDDFTVITEFEHFVVAVEALVQEWGLSGERQQCRYPKGFLKSCSWRTKSSLVNFGEMNKLRVTYYQPDFPSNEIVEESSSSERVPHLPSSAVEISNSETDFVYQSNITTMFGVCEFLVFSPADQIDDAIITEDQKNLVVSAFRVVQHSIDCEVPMFIQFGHVDRQLFFGTSCNKSVVAHYGGSHLRKGQMRHMHLTGLLDIFKERIKCPISTFDADDIRVSIQFDYDVKFPSYTSKDVDELCEIIDCYSIPFGSRDEPISDFNLIASWPNMKEEMVNENEYHSDLDLLRAFSWAGCVSFQYAEGLLGYVLTRLNDLSQSSEASETAFSLLNLKHSPRVFGNLTDGGIQNIRFSASSNFSITNPGGIPLDEVLLPIPKSIINRCMDKIFDVVDNKDEAEMDTSENRTFKSGPGSAIRASPVPSTAKDVEVRLVGAEVDDCKDFREDAVLRQSKWTPPDSLTCRFAIAFANASEDFVFGKHAFAQVWLEFVKRLRVYYDKMENLPGLSDVTQPNLSHCLLHQKIEMLQCCISAKRKRHELYDNMKDFGTDEFFDAQSSKSDGDSSTNVSVDEDAEWKSAMDTSRSAEVLSNQEPSGRLYPFGEMRLLKHKDTPLYVPITQDRSPMTEDMVDEYARYLSSLGDRESRVQAQLDILSSDMQAFKAANPKCCLEDFIRWHSPKDWDDEKECLSERMQLQDNTWVKCWNEAMPIPVINQTRLFNESKVAEEILSMLENASVQQMVELLRPVIFNSAVLQIVEKVRKSICNLLDKDILVQSVCRANKSGLRDDYMEALKRLKAAETTFSRYSSLWNKLRAYESADSIVEQPTESDLFQFITSLIEDATSKKEAVERNVISRGVPIFGASSSPLGNAVRNMLERYSVPGGRLPPPSRRQYVMRWSVPRPSANSRVLPQRLFASIEQEEFRLCGSFLEDTVYT